MDTTDKQAYTDKAPRNEPGLVVVSTAKLLGAAKAVVIEHQGERYELRLTRNGKLLLTK